MYPEHITKPCEEQLTNAGFKALKTPEEVTEILAEKEGTTLLVINSVCGCAAGSARPGVIKSVDGDKKPAKLYTVFAGQDLEAVAKAREFTAPYPPSSPSVALFKNGELVHFIERHQIEGRPAEMIAANLQGAYAEFC